MPRRCRGQETAGCATRPGADRTCITGPRRSRRRHGHIRHDLASALVIAWLLGIWLMLLTGTTWLWQTLQGWSAPHIRVRTDHPSLPAAPPPCLMPRQK